MLMPASKHSDEAALERPAKTGVHYEVIRKIGEGSFGIIYLGRSDLTSDLVAIKFESRKSKSPQLREEYRAYKLLHSPIARDGKDKGKPVDGIPKVYYFGQELLFNYLIMDYLGPSLEDQFDRCGRRFSVKTVCYCAIEMINRIRTIHEHGLIYRDIKPDNFLLDRNGDRIFIVDFGMAKHYRDPKTNQHIPYREKKSLSGTARYMSVNTHLGREQSRRDDMEALGHVFLYFLRGSLPWQGLKARDNREKYEKIGQKKQSIRVEELCYGFPSEFATYMAYARRLGFEEEPNYDECIEWFQSVLKVVDPEHSLPLDWSNLPRNWEGEGRGTRQTQYESPHLSPNHLPLTSTLKPMVEPRKNAAPIATASPRKQAMQDGVQLGVTRHGSGPLDGPEAPRRSVLRRLFCLCKKGPHEHFH